MTLAMSDPPGRGIAIATPSKRRAALASSKPTAHNGSGVPCSEVSPRGRYGATGEQKHLPDWIYTMAAKKRRFGAFVNRSDERK